jgi:hypothetical protein
VSYIDGGEMRLGPLRGPGHPGRIAGTMADGMDDDLGFSNLVENEIRIGRRRQAANDRIIGANADKRMNQ